ncbi:PTS lactose/cellobiose transporter subunit IIA (plasmid) [Entomospira entomophila]|uniref:PTS system lactose-specific EIIA component n=2 Tax=Entomospira entomophila TaxID=2719988 RepID=A0A968GA25_9SPIO|nr:PTS lactose/cellobiose transporter subunit IIA [Entomospira entomophilus]NIZ41292.1 PTS lactose/cellobiose transporter subunit IIA [Entomospira entomophilus]WDI36276.1 PTS lactose/cellobiose transporter subunit IIA [Entomospira entomophilus]
MSKEESAMTGLEIVAYAGDARSKLLNALQSAKKGQITEAQAMMAEATELISLAHKTQTQMLQAEAAGESNEISFIMIHGQDHLMTTMLLRDLMEHFIELYREKA